MPYDVTTITVAPNAHIKALPFVESALATASRKGEFLACLYADIGELNRVMLLHSYGSEADLAADRAAMLSAKDPFGMGDMMRGLSSDTFIAFPFMPAIKPGQYGPVFEVRTYLFRPGGLTATIDIWAKAAPARMKLSPILAAMYSVTGEAPRFMHIWPYPDLVTRGNTRKTAIETGVWPPPGGPDYLQTMRTDIFLPAPFSPIR